MLQALPKMFMLRISQFLLSIVFAVCAIFPVSAVANSIDSFQWQNGDLIFQTSESKQSWPIMWASKSVYSHVGIIEVIGNRKFVIEAISPVSRTDLNSWISRGRFSRFSIYRFKGLNEKQGLKVVAEAKKYLGRPYDIFFSFKNNSIYCSELAYLAFKGIQKEVGHVQRISDIDADNWFVKYLAKQRWKNHPTCQLNHAKSFEECWPEILNENIITPDGLTEDSQFEKVYWNYWFF
jgi:hypothetical protein